MSENIKATEINPETARLMQLATWCSVSVALLLVVVKFAAWLATDSISIMSSLADSVLDMIASLLSFFAIRYSLIPADREHRFGHTGAEDIASLAQAAFIAGSAIFIGVVALGRIFRPEEIDQSAIGIGIMIFSIIATFFLVVFQKYVVKKTGSTAINADSLHYVSDLMMNLAVIVAILLSVNLGWSWADPVFAFCIAGYILKSAWNIGDLACGKLMDKEFPEKERSQLKEFILNFPGVLGMHDLKTRYSGIKPFIQFHVEVKKDLTLVEAHEIADQLELELLKMFDGGEVIIHQDPV